MSKQKTAPADEYPTESYADAIQAIASGVKVLTDAGMGAACAGELAFKVWCSCCGMPCPTEPTPAE